MWHDVLGNTFFHSTFSLKRDRGPNSRIFSFPYNLLFYAQWELCSRPKRHLIQQQSSNIQILGIREKKARTQ